MSKSFLLLLVLFGLFFLFFSINKQAKAFDCPSGGWGSYCSGACGGCGISDGEEVVTCDGSVIGSQCSPSCVGACGSCVSGTPECTGNIYQVNPGDTTCLGLCHDPNSCVPSWQTQGPCPVNPTSGPPPDGGGGGGCSGISYYPNPAPPFSPNTNTTVNISRSGATPCSNWQYVGLKLDGTPQGLALCYADGTNCGEGYHGTINTGSAGPHSLLFTVNNSTCECNTYSFTTLSPTPIPPLCTVTGQSPTSGCYGSFPTLLGTYGSGADQERFLVTTDAGLSNSVCDSGFTTSSTFGSCSASTNTYYWSSQSKSTIGACVQSSLAPVYTLGVDSSAPAKPVTPAASYNAGTKEITFTWSSSTDAGCFSCNGYANKYWLRGWWHNPNTGADSWYLNDGNWKPPGVPGTCGASISTQPVPASCAGRDGQIAHLQVRDSSDGTNTSAEQVLDASYQCPIPPPSISGLHIQHYSAGGGVAAGRYQMSGLMESENGNGYYNPLVIYPQIASNLSDPNDTSNIALVATAFVESTGIGSTSFAGLLTSANNSKGFVVVYANKTLAASSLAGTVDTNALTGATFTTRKYYVYFNGTWYGPKDPVLDKDVNLSQTGSPVYKIQILQPQAGPYKDAQTPTFTVTFYKALGSRLWSTYTLVVDANNQVGGFNKEVSSHTLPAP